MNGSQKKINLALQGGGSHGAFTWGVLDRLLEEDPHLQIEGISGTSAGALNAAVYLQGYVKNGAEGAKCALNSFWEKVALLGFFAMPQMTIFDRLLGNWNIDQSPVTFFVDLWQRFLSPYQTNPLNINPLRDTLSGLIDIPTIQACQNVKIFVAATNVETGRARIFTREDLSIDALMASACLPFAFQAVMIDGHPYWDGGYAGNPPIFPLIYRCDTPDVVLVQINPLLRPGVPDTSLEIMNRISEISFNSSMLSEMRAIAFVQRLIDDDHLKSAEAARLKRMNMHVIANEKEMVKLGSASKANTDFSFLQMLKTLGRNAAEAWLKENWENIGVQSSVDLKNAYL